MLSLSALKQAPPAADPADAALPLRAEGADSAEAAEIDGRSIYVGNVRATPASASFCLPSRLCLSPAPLPRAPSSYTLCGR